MATEKVHEVSDATPPQVRLRIQGLRPKSQDKICQSLGESKNGTSHGDMTGDCVAVIETSEETICLPGDLPVSALWDKLRELGYYGPDSISCNGDVWKPGCSKPQVLEFDQIKVVQDHFSSTSECIHLDERLIDYTNRFFGRQIQLNIDENDSNDYGVKINNLKDTRGLKIIFHRTVRMPDDDRIHQLPGSLGAFPLHSVAEYSDRLPDAIVQEGGVFMPMWQREALWMSLEAPYGTYYALRFFVGRINAVSGLEMSETKEAPGDMEGTQDYVIVPGQEWLDGICIAPGIVRQFVAMPLGSGYTVEGQKTGQERHGGLQIEIIPSLERNLRTWIKDQNGYLSASELQDYLQNNSLDEFKTPRELGLGVGDTIRLYPQEVFELVPSTLIDMIPGEQLEDDAPAFTSTYHDAFIVSDARRKNKQKKKKSISLSFDSYRTGTITDDDGSSVGEKDLWSMGMSDGRITLGETSYEQIWETPMGQIEEATSHMRIADGIANLQDLLAPDEKIGGSSFEQGEPIQEASQAEKKPTITTKDLKAMGLAAGGKLVQDIYRDWHPAHIWNTKATRLVHVHILDPASYEAVTHIVPPPPPIDAMGYIEEGGSFFVVEEQPENRVDGGDFDNVKSVSAMDKDQGVRTEPSLDPTQPTRVRPCDHQFCNVCVREVDPTSSITGSFASVEPWSGDKWFCPTCKAAVSYVAGFSAPMNLPGEESVKVRLPVHVLEIKDGRVAFKSIRQFRI
ncbi:uncharacterized protein Z520_00785 [Fonsecaea multimorphosa CBS 102226]|uniref:RING-type domain-containing protein n=1 Tax=Fonsecaea multimorphosa CBS 102226 TaxID=1442371 RepID=A0A0D2KD87_9EURO|nr:uncharacterized protein Z520_00785 [Fonsecaea multimorphosa CBS 102226]KIY04093.1 hypothetical protein Z520_00785 [Fonsecaea multimorphosa CBS 102226]